MDDQLDGSIYRIYYDGDQDQTVIEYRGGEVPDIITDEQVEGTIDVAND